jgi:hypothetical protein
VGNLAQTLIVNGALEDQAVGYSADLSFATDAVSASGPTPETIAELGLMAGAADPMMSFPAGTTFTPYSVLRNVSDAPLAVTPTLWWMAAGSPQSAQLTSVSIPPHQTLGLDVMSLLAQAGLTSATKTFNGSFNLVFDANIRTGALLLAAGSVDQTGTYVFEVIPRGVAEGGSKSLQYWSTGNGDDTMITMWNPTDEAQDFVVTLFFGLPDGTHRRLGHETSLRFGASSHRDTTAIQRQKDSRLRRTRKRHSRDGRFAVDSVSDSNVPHASIPGFRLRTQHIQRSRSLNPHGVDRKRPLRLFDHRSSRQFEDRARNNSNASGNLALGNIQRRLERSRHLPPLWRNPFPPRRSRRTPSGTLRRRQRVGESTKLL